MTISTPRPPHRLERLRAWMADEQVECTVVFGADAVNHLCGYWRYFGGPSALIVGAAVAVLVTGPLPTGSPTSVNTIGTVVV